MQTVLRYPEQEVRCYFEGTFVNARNAAMIEFMGTEGTIYIDRGRYEVHPELRKTTPLEYSEWILGSGAAHMANKALRTRQTALWRA